MREASDNPLHAEIRRILGGDPTFVRLVGGSPVRKDGSPWQKVTVRPVEIRGERQLQFTLFDGRQSFDRNVPPREIDTSLNEILILPFTRWHIHTTTQEINVRVTRNGVPLISRKTLATPRHAPAVSHDKPKPRPLGKGADEFLRAVGILGDDGRVKASMQDKHRQVNEFVRILAALVDAGAPQPAWRIVDCGCGTAYLTFAACHYLRGAAGLSVRLDGVDSRPDRVAAGRAIQGQLGWDGIEFHETAIAAFQPGEPAPDITLSLHACDTATDETLAQGIRWGSRIILAVPCCQHELNASLKVDLFRPLLRHGILRERMADLLTDAFRAQILRIMGYQTDVIEFISPTHTARNIMIRAVKRSLAPPDPRRLKEYTDLKSFWNVQPVLESMLAGLFPVA